MGKVLNAFLIILNIGMFALMGFLVFKSNMVLKVFGIPHEGQDDAVEGFSAKTGFSYRNVEMPMGFFLQRNMIQKVGRYQ